MSGPSRKCPVDTVQRTYVRNYCNCSLILQYHWTDPITLQSIWWWVHHAIKCAYYSTGEIARIISVKPSRLGGHLSSPLFLFTSCLTLDVSRVNPASLRWRNYNEIQRRQVSKAPVKRRNWERKINHKLLSISCENYMLSSSESESESCTNLQDNCISWSWVNVVWRFNRVSCAFTVINRILSLSAGLSCVCWAAVRLGSWKTLKWIFNHTIYIFFELVVTPHQRPNSRKFIRLFSLVSFLFLHLPLFTSL